MAWSSNRVAWTYTDENGKNYRVNAVKYLTDQGLLGGSDGSAVAATKPKGLKMRRITVRTATGVSRVLPVYSPGADIQTVGTSINIGINGSLTSAVSSGSTIPESYTRLSPTTRQNT